MSDFYQNLAANEYSGGADSEVSEADPEEIISKTKTTSKTALSSKKFPDFDEDDPLADLLPDDDDISFSKNNTTETSGFDSENKPKAGVGDISTKSNAKKNSPTKTETANSVKQDLLSGLDWLSTKTLDLNKDSQFGTGRHGQFSSKDLVPNSRASKTEEEDLGVLDLLNDDTKRLLSNQDKNTKRKLISDIFNEDTIKASSSSEVTTNPTQSTRPTKDPGDWLGLKDTDSNLGAGDISTFGLSSGDSGRRPRTAVPDPEIRQESRPKTASSIVPKPRSGRSEVKTPQSILKSFMNDYDSPTILSASLDVGTGTADVEADSGRKSGYMPSAGSREPRRGGRRSSTGLPDPLGLFSSTQEQSNQNIETTPSQREPKPVSENPSRAATKPANPTINPAPATTNARTAELPAWLGGGVTQRTDTSTNVSPSTSNTSQNPPATTIAPTHTSTQSSVTIPDPGQLLTSMSQMEAGYTEVMSQQVQGLTAALSLRRQEEAMAALQMRQAVLIRQYEHQLNELMQRQMQRQQQMEQTMTHQQEQIQKHIEALISQPTNPHPFITHSQLFMPKQGNSDGLPSTDTQDNISELKLKIQRLEHEKYELQESIEKERKRYEDRLYDLEEGYRKQMTALEVLLEKQEKRMLQERQEIEKDTAERINRLKEEHAEASNQQAERMASLHEEWLSDLRRLGEFHKEAVEMLRSEQSSAIQHWNEMKSSELNLIRDSSTNIQTLKEALSQLEESTESLKEIKLWMSSKENKQYQEREAALHEREAHLTALQQTLDKEISNVAAERANLTSLARELEERIAKQKEDSEKNLKSVESKENAWRQEKEQVANAMREERERIQELRFEAEAEIKRLSKQKAELSTELTRLEIERKITEESINQRLQEIKKMEEEAKALLATAEAKAADAKREKEVAQNEQRALLEEGMQINSRAQGLDSLAKSIQHDKMAAEEARAEGAAALAEARRLEREQADNGAELARQIAFLKEREHMLCQEKLSLSMEWKRLRDNRARGLCLQCSQHISSHQGKPIRRPQSSDVVDPLPIIMRLRAERSSDFSDFDLPDPVPSVLDVISQ